jgi:outer membrane immunogenic protein
MMTLLLMSAAALAFATPAAAQNAQFVGPRVELQTGINGEADRDVTYGAVLGYDVPITGRATLGADIDATNVFDKDGRILGAGARLGYALHRDVLAYGRLGYANLDAGRTNLHGVTAGGGLNLRILPHTYINTEYRYTNYNRGVDSHAGLLGIGFRF